MKTKWTHAQIRELFLKGAKLAFERLVRQAASEGRSLVIVENGQPVNVPATELMKKHKIKDHE